MSGSGKRIFLFIFFISGASGLIYEIVWSHMLVFVFGGTSYAITTVLSCFMGGLALGSFAGGRLSTRIRRPERIYGIFEILIGLYCLSIPYLITLAYPLYRILTETFGESFSLLTVARVIVSTAILIFPTTLMGATLPLLARAFIHRTDELGRNTGRLYGFNTIGAFTGCVLAGFFLLPTVGLSFSIYIAAALNLLAGIAAVLLSETKPLTVDASLEQARPQTEYQESAMSRPLLLFLFGLSGFAALAYQIAWTRALIMSMGSSVYAFSTIVACFILGLAVGSIVISYWADRLRNPLLVAGLLEGTIGLGAIVVVPLFGKMPELVHGISTATGATFQGVLGIEILSVLGLLALPTLCMGALLPLVCRLYDPRPAEAGRNVGNVYASNTFGTIMGTLAAGFILIPNTHIGMQRTIIAASALSGLIGTVFILFERRWRRRAVLAFIGVAWGLGIVVSAVMNPWSREAMVSAPYLGRGMEDQTVMYYREDTDATVAVTYSDGTRSLRINGKTDASTGRSDVITQYLLSQIPLLLRPDARDVLIIGLGSGATAGAALAYPLERMDVAEISASVIEAAKYFSEINNGVLTDPRVHIHRTDARNYLLLTERKYDIIVSEPSNPWMSGISNLFTREFFELAKKRLRPGGIHGQWIHSYLISRYDLGSIIRTMSEVFPHVQVWEMDVSDLIILGSESPITIDVEQLYLNFSREPVSKVLSRIFLNDPMQIANHYIADGEHMARSLSDKRVLTDDLPYLEFSAPQHLLNEEVSAEAMDFIYDFKGFPTLSGNAGSPLNGEFLEGIEWARERRNYIAMMAGSMKDAEADLESIEKVFRYGNDIRTLGYQGSSSVLYWPFSRKIRPSSETGTMLREVDRLRASGSEEKALAAAKKSLRENPDQPALLDRTGRLTLELASADEAIPYLLKALVRDPRDPDVNYDLARAYAQRGDNTLALRFLEKALGEGSHEAGDIRSDPMLDTLRGDPRFEELLEQDSR